MKELFRPLASMSRQGHALLWGGLALLVLYLYPGNHAFFLAHFPVEGRFADWAGAGWQHGSALVLLCGVPILGLLLARRPVPGLALGDWRFGLKVTAAAMAGLVVPLWLTGGDPAFQAEYPLARAAGDSVGLFLLWEMTYLVYYVAWEFFFRGLWQLGLEPDLGAMGALALQASVSTVMHIGKPMGETAAAVAGGLLLGLLALRTRSILYPLLIHWYLGALTDAFCIVRGGP